MQIVIFIIILIPIMLYSKSWYPLSPVPCNFINISPKPCKCKRTSVPCFSWSFFLQIYQFFQVTGKNHAELQSTELQPYEIVLLKFLLFVLKILSVTYIMSKILVLWVYPFYRNWGKHVAFPSVINIVLYRNFSFL